MLTEKKTKHEDYYYGLAMEINSRLSNNDGFISLANCFEVQCCGISSTQKLSSFTLLYSLRGRFKSIYLY